VSRELALRRAVYGVRLIRDANVRGLRASESVQEKFGFQPARPVASARDLLSRHAGRA